MLVRFEFAENTRSDILAMVHSQALEKDQHNNQPFRAVIGTKACRHEIILAHSGTTIRLDFDLVSSMRNKTVCY